MKAVTLMFVVLFAISAISATVWHVNNVVIPTGAPSILRDFTDLQSANDSPSVANGDTLYIYAGSYPGATITKQLTIIGTGYFLSENPETQFINQPSYVDVISFNSGSEYSVITGLDLRQVNVNETNNVTIKRNYIHWENSPLVHISNSFNTLVLQNYLFSQYGNNCILIDGVYSNPITGIQIKNNIIYNEWAQHDYNTFKSIYSSAACLVENNILRGCIDVIGANINNNILWLGNYYGHETSIYMNNICNSTQFALDGVNGNQCDMDILGQVILWSGSTDGRFMLRPGSPAIGAGLNGIDCGAFGGGTPYVLSGMPSEIPSVWFFESSYVGYTYPFHIKAKSHK